MTKSYSLVVGKKDERRVVGVITKRHKETFGHDIFIIFIIVLISHMYTNVRTCQIVPFKCVDVNYTLIKQFKSIFKKGTHTKEGYNLTGAINM